MKHLLLAPFLLGFISPVFAEEFTKEQIDTLNKFHTMSFIGQIGVICIARNNEYLNQFQTSEMLKWSIEYFIEGYKGNADDTIKEMHESAYPIISKSQKCKDAWILSSKEYKTLFNNDQD